MSFLDIYRKVYFKYIFLYILLNYKFVDEEVYEKIL